MQYRESRNGEKLSVLGFGCMRFTRKGGSIDIDKAEKEIMAAYEGGVNYYDTAYIYPGSEAALGEILQRNNIREKVYIATKLPQYLISGGKGIDKLFAEELERLRTDYVDFYLMHHLSDIAQWERLKNMGILDWIAERRKEGSIRNIGFSFHGNTESFLKILNDYDWDFCQIQYNYIDENSQAGATGLRAAAEKGIPVIIMEPLRGGKLVNMLPEGARKAISENGRGWSAAEWGLRWLYNQKEVTVVLSGMNSLEMVQENIRTASDSPAGHLTDADFAVIDTIRREFAVHEKVGCTGCRYCMPCPRGVDIPGIFSCWNTMYSESKLDGRRQYFQAVALTREPSHAGMCIGCGKCEKHCPQSIPIRQKLKEADREIRRFPYNAVISVGRRIMMRSAAKRKKD